MMTATFNGNPRATIISCYSPTNISEETKLATFYDELSSLVRSIPKYNLLSLEEIWMPKSGKTDITNTTYKTHQIEMDNI